MEQDSGASYKNGSVIRLFHTNSAIDCVNLNALIAQSPYIAFISGLNSLEQMTRKPHQYFASAERAFLHTLTKLAFTPRATMQQLAEDHLCLNVKPDGIMLREEERHTQKDVGIYNPWNFVDRAQRLGGILLDNQTTNDDEKFMEGIGLETGNHFRNSIIKSIVSLIRPLSLVGDDLRKTAFIINSSYLDRNKSVMSGEIADTYNYARSHVFTKLTGICMDAIDFVSNGFKKKSKPNNSKMEYQYATWVRDNAKCYGNIELIDNIAHPNIATGEEIIHGTCHSCPLFDAKTGIKCGIAALRAKRYHEQLANRHGLDFNGSSYKDLSIPGNITNRLKAANIIADIGTNI
jgi:hypothetical protein